MSKGFTERDVERQAQAMQRAANRLFGKDSEGDPKVEVMLIDRTRYEPFHYEPVLYRHKDREGRVVGEEVLGRADEAVVEERQQMMQMNLETAVRDLSLESRIVRAQHSRLDFARSPKGRKLITAHRRMEHNAGSGVRGCPVCDGVVPNTLV